MQLQGFAHQNNLSRLHDDYYASEARGIYSLVINNIPYIYMNTKEKGTTTVKYSILWL